MKILALTSIRSEYDLLSGLFSKLNSDENINLKLIVGGAHNSPTFGLTHKDIELDGLDILLRAESLLDADSSSSRLKSASILLMSIIDVVKGFDPDLIIYAGDREEVMVGALLGGYLGVPSIHFFGGDHAEDGHIDNPLRHAVSKLSTCHFVSTQEHMNRLLALAEPDFRIFNIGSVALDKFIQEPVIPDIAKRIVGREIEKPHAVLIYHPIADERGKEEAILNSMVSCLIDKGFHIFIGKPNTDEGNSSIRIAISDIEKKYDSVTVYGNLRRQEFISLFKTSSLIIGNSSAGLLEAPTIKIPSINVGERQRGRLAAESVIFVSAEHGDIQKGIEAVTLDAFQEKLKNVVNPYGDGHSVDKAFSLIKTIDFLSMFKKKEDPLDVIRA